MKRIRKKTRKLRFDRDKCISPRKLLEHGHWQRLTFEEKVFVALTWCGFTNSEAWGVIYPLSDASPNSKAVMAGRMACNASIKNYIDVLNDYLDDCALRFKGQKFIIGRRQVEDAKEELENKYAIL